MPDTGYEAPIHKDEWAEYRSDPINAKVATRAQGLKPAVNAAVKRSPQFTWRDQLLGWSAPGVVRARLRACSRCCSR